MSEKIYRITNLERFKETVERQVLGFVTYDTWEDINEGYVLRAIRADGGRKKIFDVLRDLKMDRATSGLTIEILDAMCHSIHMQSWSLTEESDAMWKLYSSEGNGVQIVTSLDKISLLDGVGYLKVRYEKLQLREELRRIARENQIKNAQGVAIQMDQVFATKSPAFEHEREVRLYTSIDQTLVKFHHQQKAGEFSPGVVRELVTKIISNGELKPSDMGTIMRQVNPNWLKQVPFGHITGFIESVRVSPTATGAFIKDVEATCIANGLLFGGKSQLYSYCDIE